MDSSARTGSRRRVVATLVAAVAAVGATAMLIHILRACHDTDAHSGIAITFFLWPIATPVLWLLEAVILARTFAVLARLVPVRRARVPLMTVAAIVVLGLVTWAYWNLGLTMMSTGLVFPECPGGAPAWWPAWLPLNVRFG